LHQTKEERRALLEQQYQIATFKQNFQPYPMFYSPVQNVAGPYMIQQPQADPTYNSMRGPRPFPQSRPMAAGYPVRSGDAGAYIGKPRLPRGAGGGRGGSYPSTRGVPTTTMMKTTNVRPPLQAGINPPVSQQIAPATNLTMLASLPADEQKHVLGEKLFPLVHKMHPNLAAKITGMLLELDTSDVLSYLESPDQLAKKVQEAEKVLKEHNAIPSQ